MADVWKAALRGPSDFRKVFTLKVLLQELSAGRDFVEVFTEEARLLASLAHPNIVTVTDFGEEGGRWFVATEYVHGKDLDAVLKRLASRGQRLSPEMAYLVGADLASALAAAHSRSGPDGAPVVHREIFPKNVLLSYQGETKLCDFRSTRVRSVAPAKLVYRSPEQSRGDQLDRRSDLFSLALLVFDLATGTRPLDGGAPPRDTGGFVVPEAVISTLPDRARAVFRKALAVDRNARFQDATELEAAFDELLAGRGREVRRALRAMLEHAFAEEMRQEATEDPAAPLPRAGGDLSAATLSTTVPGAPATPARRPTAPEGPGFGARMSAQPAQTAVTEPGGGPAGASPDPFEGTQPLVAALPAEPVPPSATRGPAKAPPVSVFDDEPPGAKDIARPFPGDPFEDVDEGEHTTRRPIATRVSADPPPAAVADLARAPHEPSRSAGLFPAKKGGDHPPLLLAGVATGAILGGVLGFFVMDAILRSGGVAPDLGVVPTATSTVVAAVTEAPEATPTPAPEPATPVPLPSGAKRSQTPRPVASVTPLALAETPRVIPTPIRISTATPRVAAPTRAPATPTPAPVVVVTGPAGEVSVKSVPPVTVWVDGRRLKGTPLITKVPAGIRKLRFTNDEEEFDYEREVEVPSNQRIEVEIDIENGKVLVRKK